MKKLIFADGKNDFLDNAERIFLARIVERDCHLTKGIKITIQLDRQYEAEKYAISGPQGGDLLLSGGSEAALLYALGKLLRTGNFANGFFTPGTWRGAVTPQKHFRCVYFASHFFNCYHVGPEAMVQHYIEDMALLGYNYISLTVSKHIYPKNDQRLAKEYARYRRLLLFANSLGMKARVGISNVGSCDNDESILAKPTGRSFFGTEICPSIPEGLEQIVANNIHFLEQIKDVDVGNVNVWSYDQGGCGCEKCAPYGANGMFIWADKLVPTIHELWPDCKISWATWLYDREGFPLGEWEGLYKRINEGKADYIDYIMADSHDSFPEYPLKHQLPQNVKLITFPEISMYGRSPWGGFGATPQPKRFARLWGEVCHLSDGGVLYSEGVFEDFNKVLYAQFFTTGNNETQLAVDEYARFYLGIPESQLGKFYRLLEIFEDNHKGLVWWRSAQWEMLEPMKNKPLYRSKGKTWRNSGEAYTIVCELDKIIPAWARKIWRWRIIFLRALIDDQLAQNANEPNDQVEGALTELFHIYQLDVNTATRRITPYTNEWLKYGHDTTPVQITKKIGLD